MLPLPAFLLRLALGVLARELLLGGQRVLPDKACATGFVFRHPTLGAALTAMLAARQRSNTSSAPPLIRSRIALAWRRPAL